MAGENAARRGRLFDLYVRQPGHEDITEGCIFWCPLCRRPFGRDATAGDSPRLTLAHIIPESLGGTWATLACAECNNGHGHRIEADLLANRRFADWAAGRGPMPVRMGDGGRVRAVSQRDPATTRFRHGYTGGVSNAFRQLYLKQRLVSALVGGDDLAGGIEFDGVLRPVRGNRRRKIGKNLVVRQAVAMLRRYAGRAYYLLLTPETVTPGLVEGLRAAHSFGPATAEPRPRGWDLTRWGLVSVRDVVALCQSSGMRHAAEVARFNDGQLL